MMISRFFYNKVALRLAPLNNIGTIFHGKWLIRRVAQIAQMNDEVDDFYKNLSGDGPKRIDNTFSRPDDEDLTPDEIRQIDEFWAPYKFAYPEIDYNSFKIFKNRCGFFSPLHCPPGIRWRIFQKYFLAPGYKVAYQNKTLLHKNFINTRQPVTVVRRINGFYFDEHYNHIELEDALRICVDTVAGGQELIIKPNGSSGGAGICFIKTTDTEVIRDIFKSMGISAFVVQHVLKQSATMAKFNPNSVNTMRITTLCWKGEIHVLAALVRVGGGSNRVDNWCSGGSLVGIDLKTHCCLPWALDNTLGRVTTLPSGLDLAAAPIEIPNFDKIMEFVKEAHYQGSYIRMIAWDIALNENDEPVMIEANFAGMLQIHEATTGPLFGEYLKPLLDEYALRRFCHKRGTIAFNYREYHDHIVLDEYLSPLKKVIIPTKIHGKPVTAISPKAFRDRSDVTSIIVSKRIKTTKKTFASCTSLKLHRI